MRLLFVCLGFFNHGNHSYITKTLITVIYTEISYPVHINHNYYQCLPATLINKHTICSDILSQLNNIQEVSSMKKAVDGVQVPQTCSFIPCHYNQWYTIILSHKLVITSQGYFHISRVYSKWKTLHPSVVRQNLKTRGTRP